MFVLFAGAVATVCMVAEFSVAASVTGFTFAAKRTTAA
jgi:hypothetical protein